MAKTSAVRKTSNLTLLNIPEDELKRPLQFTLLKPASEEDLIRRRTSVTSESQTWRELTHYLAAVAQGSVVAPYELGLVIDFESPEIKRDLEKLKNPKLTLLTKIRTLLKALQLDDQIELHQYGPKLAIVGKRG